MASSIVDHPLISQRYLPTRRFCPPDPFWIDCGSARLACHLAAPHPGALTLVHFHGNGEIVADYLGMVKQALTGLGLNLLLAEYRGYGGSTGQPGLGAMLDDMPYIVEALGLPEQQLVPFGRSVGSLYAIEVADRFPGVAGMIIESGVADPLERVLMRVAPEEMGVSLDELRQACDERFDLAGKLGRYHKPLLLLHARRDSHVGAYHAERLQTWAGGPTRLRLFEQGDHSTIMIHNQAEYLAEIGSFCAALTPASGPGRIGLRSRTQANGC